MEILSGTNFEPWLAVWVPVDGQKHHPEAGFCGKGQDRQVVGPADELCNRRVVPNKFLLFISIDRAINYYN